MMNAYLDGSEFALKRFEISSSKVSFFIASVQSVRSLATLLALVVGVILLLIGDNFSIGSWWNKAGAILSAFFLALFAFLQLKYFCSSHGHQYVVRYFWLHVATGFCIGLLLIYPFHFFGQHGHFLSYGLQITGAFTSILHYTLKKVMNFLQLDLNFWLIAIHLFVVFLIAFLGFTVFSIAVAQHGQGGGSSGGSGSSSAGIVLPAFLIFLLFLSGLLFQASNGTAAFFLLFTGFVTVVASIAGPKSIAIFAAVMFSTFFAILSGLLILYGFLFWGVIVFLFSVVAFAILIATVVLQGDLSENSKASGALALLLILMVLMFLTILLILAGHGTAAFFLFLMGLGTVVVSVAAAVADPEPFAIFAAVVFPTFLAILSGVLILSGFMFWGSLFFLVSVVLFFLFTAAVVGFPSEPSKALVGAWALLLILVVLMFLTILLFQAGHGTAAFFLFLMGLGTVVFTSASSGVSKNPPSFGKFKLGARGAWAPITMAVVGMAFEFVIYPVICPILTVESSKHHTIILWALIVETASGFMVFSLTGIDKDIKTYLWTSGPQVFYHLLWLMFIPYLGLGLMFLWALHHPNSGFSRRLKFGIWGGILTCVYYFFVENLVNIGFGCVYDHAEKGAQGSASSVSDEHRKAAGYVANFNNCLTNSFSVIFGFLMKAHLANYLNCSRKLAEGHVFPTDSMGWMKACWFWFSCASSGAWKNFISLFSLDIKEMLLS
ncbi:hypothetical protein BdWA1_000770 [Babesia duncani]|uniref:Uncharacterized protein n=1 Tax=Babesia duncani TaxID=323732 RepID=A0AAD9PMW9_9APIC|nr:hypothetical protein BdWA1_000770 [Babesia duncani]